MPKVVVENPLLSPEESIPDVFVKYDTSKDRFEVIFTETNTAYFVRRGSLVGDLYKYTDTIVNKILDGIGECPESPDEEDIIVVFSNRAHEEVHAIWMANCDLF